MTHEEFFNRTLKEIIDDPKFVKSVVNRLKALIKSREVRPEPRTGMKYKRDWYDRLSTQNVLTKSFFLENIEAIWSKKSTLNREQRGLVAYVCDHALTDTLTTYLNQEERKKQQKVK